MNTNNTIISKNLFPRCPWENNYGKSLPVSQTPYRCFYKENAIEAAIKNYQGKIQRYRKYRNNPIKDQVRGCLPRHALDEYNKGELKKLFPHLHNSYVCEAIAGLDGSLIAAIQFLHEFSKHLQFREANFFPSEVQMTAPEPNCPSDTFILPGVGKDIPFMTMLSCFKQLHKDNLQNPPCHTTVPAPLNLSTKRGSTTGDPRVDPPMNLMLSTISQRSPPTPPRKPSRSGGSSRHHVVASEIAPQQPSCTVTSQDVAPASIPPPAAHQLEIANYLGTLPECFHSSLSNNETEEDGPLDLSPSTNRNRGRFIPQGNSISNIARRRSCSALKTTGYPPRPVFKNARNFRKSIGNPSDIPAASCLAESPYHLVDYIPLPPPTNLYPKTGTLEDKRNRKAGPSEKSAKGSDANPSELVDQEVINMDIPKLPQGTDLFLVSSAGNKDKESSKNRRLSTNVNLKSRAPAHDNYFQLMRGNEMVTVEENEDSSEQSDTTTLPALNKYARRLSTCDTDGSVRLNILDNRIVSSKEVYDLGTTNKQLLFLNPRRPATQNKMLSCAYQNLSNFGRKRTSRSASCHALVVTEESEEENEINDQVSEKAEIGGRFVKGSNSKSPTSKCSNDNKQLPFLNFRRPATQNKMPSSCSNQNLSNFGRKRTSRSASCHALVVTEESEEENEINDQVSEKAEIGGRFVKGSNSKSPTSKCSNDNKQLPFLIFRRPATQNKMPSSCANQNLSNCGRKRTSRSASCHTLVETEESEEENENNNQVSKEAEIRSRFVKGSNSESPTSKCSNDNKQLPFLNPWRSATQNKMPSSCANQNLSNFGRKRTSRSASCHTLVETEESEEENENNNQVSEEAEIRGRFVKGSNSKSLTSKCSNDNKQLPFLNPWSASCHALVVTEESEEENEINDQVSEKAEIGGRFVKGSNSKSPTSKCSNDNKQLPFLNFRRPATQNKMPSSCSNQNLSNFGRKRTSRSASCHALVVTEESEEENEINDQVSEKAEIGGRFVKGSNSKSPTSKCSNDNKQLPFLIFRRPATQNKMPSSCANQNLSNFGRKRTSRSASCHTLVETEESEEENENNNQVSEEAEIRGRFVKGSNSKSLTSKCSNDNKQLPFLNPWRSATQNKMPSSCANPNFSNFGRKRTSRSASCHTLVETEQSEEENENNNQVSEEAEIRSRFVKGSNSKSPTSKCSNDNKQLPFLNFRRPATQNKMPSSCSNQNLSNFGRKRTSRSASCHALVETEESEEENENNNQVSEKAEIRGRFVKGSNSKSPTSKCSNDNKQLPFLNFRRPATQNKMPSGCSNQNLSNFGRKRTSRSASCHALVETEELEEENENNSQVSEEAEIRGRFVKGPKSPTSKCLNGNKQHPFLNPRRSATQNKMTSSCANQNLSNFGRKRTSRSTSCHTLVETEESEEENENNNQVSEEAEIRGRFVKGSNSKSLTSKCLNDQTASSSKIISTNNDTFINSTLTCILNKSNMFLSRSTARKSFSVSKRTLQTARKSFPTLKVPQTARKFFPTCNQNSHNLITSGGTYKENTQRLDEMDANASKPQNPIVNCDQSFFSRTGTYVPKQIFSNRNRPSTSSENPRRTSSTNSMLTEPIEYQNSLLRARNNRPSQICIIKQYDKSRTTSCIGGSNLHRPVNDPKLRMEAVVRTPKLDLKPVFPGGVHEISMDIIDSTSELEDGKPAKQNGIIIRKVGPSDSDYRVFLL